MLFTVIIPVYNVEKYLEECVSSVLSQDFSGFDVVLVDDGSTDSSGKIADLIAEKDGRVRVIHRENGGLSAARNTGLETADGDYILFVDSDDLTEPGSLAAIAKKIEGSGRPDAVFLEAEKFYPDGRREPMGDGYCPEAIDGKSADDVLRFLASRPKFPGSACTKAVKRSLIEDNSLTFREGEFAEDTDWTCRLLAAAKSFAYCEAPYYRYRQMREGSITDSCSRPHVEALLGVIERYSTREVKNERDKIFNSFMAYETGVAVVDYASLPKDDKAALKERLKGVMWLLKYGGARGRALRLAGKLLGVDAAAGALSVYYKTRK